MPAAPRPPRTSDLRHPRLAEHAFVLARTPDEWQVGLEPGQALVLRGAGFARLLPLLDGRHSMGSVRELARAERISSRTLNAALSALLAAELLTDRATADPPAPPVRVRLVGAGPLGAQLARLLLTPSLIALYVYDDEPPEPALYPNAGVLSTRSQALRSALLDCGTAVTALNHWSKPDGVRPDLTVVAVEAPEVDRLVTDHLVQTDQPHLVVRSHRRGVCVGPLVVPGRTSCLRCADLARRDVDPHWPSVLTQLVRLSSPPPPLLVGWAASVAAVQATAFLAGGSSETLGSTLEIDGADLTMRRRVWPVHPGCGCGWVADTEWGP